MVPNLSTRRVFAPARAAPIAAENARRAAATDDDIVLDACIIILCHKFVHGISPLHYYCHCWQSIVDTSFVRLLRLNLSSVSGIILPE
jgi:hypothetical protein